VNRSLQIFRRSKTRAFSKYCRLSRVFGGNDEFGNPFREPAAIAASTPRTGRILPESSSSPITRMSPEIGAILAAAITERAIGKSRAAPAFFNPAGARFINILSKGKLNPEFLNAARTLSRASLTAPSASPVISTPGIPLRISVSTRIMIPPAP